MTRYFENAAARNLENSVARLLESGGAAAPSSLWKGVGVIRDATASLVNPTDLATLNCSWYYDWANAATPGLGAVPSTPNIEYVPMMWGDWELYGEPDPVASIGSSPTMLGFNEPNVSDQANMTVARALQLWPAMEASRARLGSPAVSGDPGLGYGTTWMTNFMSGNGGPAPRVDFICAHWYVEYDAGYGNVGDYLDYLHTTYGKPIWLTEVGSLGTSVATNASLLPTVMSACAARPWVERIGWFFLSRTPPSNPGSTLVNSNGSLNAAGTVYAGYPRGDVFQGWVIGRSTVTGTLSTGGAVALVGSSAGTSTASATMAVNRSLVATASAGTSTTTAALGVNRSLIAVASAGTSTASAPMGVNRSLVATASAGTSTTTAAMGVTKSLSGTSGPALGVSTLFSDTFNGTAGTALTAFGYMGDGYSTMLVLDGAGNAVVQPPNTYSGVVRPEVFPDNCWAECTFSVPAVGTAFKLYVEIRMPWTSWYHGYNLYLIGASLCILRNDYGTGSGGSPAAPITLQANFDHVARIEMRGFNFQVFLDGVLKLDWTDPVPLTVASGQLGPYHGVALDPSSTSGYPFDQYKLKDYRIGGLEAGVSATGALTVTKSLAGTSDGLSSVTGTLAGSSVQLLTGNSAGSSTAVANALAVVDSLVGSSAGTSTVAASPMGVNRSLVGSSAGTSTASATRLNANQALVGVTSAGTSTASATEATALVLGGSSAGTSAATGTLATTAANAFAGASDGSSGSTAAMGVVHTLISSAAGTSSASGSLARAVPLLATASSGTSTASASLIAAKTLAGSSDATSTAASSGSQVVRSLAGSSAGSTTVAPAILTTNTSGGLSGVIAGTSTAVGTLATAVRMVGSSAGSSTAGAGLSRTYALGGSSAGTSTASAAIGRTTSLGGASGGSSAATGTLREVLALMAVAAGLSDAIATIVMTRGLAGSSNGVAVASGNLQAIFISPIFGIWNGQPFDAMQYGDKPVAAWLLEPS